MDRFEKPLSREAYTRVCKIDELDAAKQERDLELEETAELAELKRARSPIGYIVGD